MRRRVVCGASIETILGWMWRNRSCEIDSFRFGDRLSQRLSQHVGHRFKQNPSLMFQVLQDVSERGIQQMTDAGDHLSGALCVCVEVASVHRQQGVFLGSGQIRVSP